MIMFLFLFLLVVVAVLLVLLYEPSSVSVLAVALLPTTRLENNHDFNKKKTLLVVPMCSTSRN